MVSAASSIEPTRALFLHTTLGELTSAALTTTANAAQNNFLEWSLFPKVVFQFPIEV